MLSYSVTCRKTIGSKNSKVAKVYKEKLMLLYEYVVWNS